MVKKENERAESASNGSSSKLLLGKWTAIDIALSLRASDTPLVIDSIELECGPGSNDRKTGSGVQGTVLSFLPHFLFIELLDLPSPG